MNLIILPLILVIAFLLEAGVFEDEEENVETLKR
jgi:hypothetical protein